MNEEKILQAIEALSKQVDTRLNGVEKRLGDIETEQASFRKEIESRFDAVDARFDTLESALVKEMRAGVEFTCDKCADIEDKLDVLSVEIINQKAAIRRLKAVK